jgi:hypothetical protein
LNDPARPFIGSPAALHQAVGIVNQKIQNADALGLAENRVSVF